MASIFYLILVLVMILIIVSALKPHGKDIRYNGTDNSKDDNSHQIFMNTMMNNNANDLNGNGIPDYIENGNIDSDHDGIPDNVDFNSGLFDGNANDSGFNNDSLGGLDSSIDYDLSSSFDNGSFDSGCSGSESSSGDSF